MEGASGHEQVIGLGADHPNGAVPVIDLPGRTTKPARRERVRISKTSCMGLMVTLPVASAAGRYLWSTEFLAPLFTP